jgi:hypothetical protein
VEIPATPETPGTVAIIREQALLNADLFLANSFGALRLSETDFAAEAKGRFRAGWSILIQPSTEERTVHLYIDTSFPFSRPSFFLIDGPGLFAWPHVEKSGKLCLLDDVKIKRPELVQDFLRSEIADAFWSGSGIRSPNESGRFSAGVPFLLEPAAKSLRQTDLQPSESEGAEPPGSTLARAALVRRRRK